MLSVGPALMLLVLAHGLVFKQWILGYFLLTSGGRRGWEASPSAHGVRRVANGG